MLLSATFLLLLLLFFFFFLLCEDILLRSLQWSEVLMQCMERSAVFIISVMTHPFVVVVVVCFVLRRHFVMESAVVRSPDAVHGEVSCIYYQCYAPSLPPYPPPPLFVCVCVCVFCFVMTFCYGATIFCWC